MKRVVLLSLIAMVCATTVPEILYQWVQIDYDWEAMGVDKNQYIQEGLFIAENCILSGIKQWKDDIYVTIPRWAPGVPATLNKIVVKNGIPLLLPFPPIEQQMINTTNGLKFVQDIEIDPFGRMWIIDTGALNFYFPQEFVWNTPRLFVYDLQSDPPTLEQSYSFPTSIAPVGQVFLNDIVVDVIRDFAYITNSIGTGGLYAYDLSSNTARYWTDQSTQIEPSETTFNIEDSGTYTINTPCDGIALSVDTSTLYYCALSGVTVYSIPTELFRNFSVSDQQLHNAVFEVGVKASQTDGMTIDSNGVMYYGGIEYNVVTTWNTANRTMTAANQFELYNNNTFMQWQDTFGFTNQGGLLLVSNRLQLFPTSYDFTGNSGANFRIFQFDIGADSYMQGALNMKNQIV